MLKSARHEGSITLRLVPSFLKIFDTLLLFQNLNWFFPLLQADEATSCNSLLLLCILQEYNWLLFLRKHWLIYFKRSVLMKQILVCIDWEPFFKDLCFVPYQIVSFLLQTELVFLLVKIIPKHSFLVTYFAHAFVAWRYFLHSFIGWTQADEAGLRNVRFADLVKWRWLQIFFEFVKTVHPI